jgi:hypothetical protein
LLPTGHISGDATTAVLEKLTFNSKKSLCRMAAETDMSKSSITAS